MSDQLKLESIIEARCTSSTAPSTAFAPRNRETTARTFVDVAIRTSLYRYHRSSHLVDCCSGHVNHPPRDAIVTMMSMPASISVDPVPHVNQFFDDDDFKGSGLGGGNPGNIDQNSVRPRTAEIDVGAANRSIDSAPKPPFEFASVGRNPERVRRKVESIDIDVDEPHNGPLMVIHCLLGSSSCYCHL